MTEEKIITLDVGGKLFKTYVSSLLKYPDTLLGKMYNENSPFKINDIQFFDRSSDIFDYILNFYRTGILYKPLFISSEMWINELNFWGFPECLDECEDIEKIFVDRVNLEIGNLVKAGLKGDTGPKGECECKKLNRHGGDPRSREEIYANTWIGRRSDGNWGGSRTYDQYHRDVNARGRGGQRTKNQYTRDVDAGGWGRSEN